jgi:hypothetical protein
LVFPAIRMVIAVNKDLALRTCFVHILRPLHTSTVFNTICGTPLFRKASPVSDGPYTAVWIEEISFTSSGSLIPDDLPRAAAEEQMVMRLNGTAICRRNLDKAGEDSFLDSCMEILKTLGKQERYNTVIEPEGSDASAANGLLRACHLGMLLSEDELRLLVEKVRSSSHPGMQLTERAVHLTDERRGDYESRHPVWRCQDIHPQKTNATFPARNSGETAVIATGSRA